MQTSMMNESVPAPLRQPKIPVLSNFKKMRGRYEVNFEGKTSSFQVSSMSVSRSEVSNYAPLDSVDYHDYLPNSILKRQATNKSQVKSKFDSYQNIEGSEKNLFGAHQTTEISMLVEAKNEDSIFVTKIPIHQEN